MDERFLYEVRPMRPITIPGKPGTKKPFTALLTKEEVRDYMKYGPVYRKYAEVNKEMVKVTGENLDKLHHDSTVTTTAKRSVADVIPVEKDQAPVVVETVAEPEPIVEEEPKKSNVEESMTVEASTEDITVAEEAVIDVASEPDTQVEVNDDAVIEESVQDEVVENTDTIEEDKVEESVDETADEEESSEEVSEESVVEEANTTSEEDNNDTSSNQSRENYNKHNKNNVQFSNKKKH